MKIPLYFIIFHDRNFKNLLILFTWKLFLFIEYHLCFYLIPNAWVLTHKKTHLNSASHLTLFQYIHICTKHLKSDIKLKIRVLFKRPRCLVENHTVASICQPSQEPCMCRGWAKAVSLQGTGWQWLCFSYVTKSSKKKMKENNDVKPYNVGIENQNKVRHCFP